MNPLHWRREHQIALAVAAALGAFVGLLYGFNYVRGVPGCSWFDTGYCHDAYSAYLRAVLKWPLFGAIIGGGIVYVRQLLRIPAR